MHNPRFIPCLLMLDGRLVKTKRFADPDYIGDPVNTVNIFSGLRADEIILLDIGASTQGREPDYRVIAEAARYTTVPFGYGGGIRTADHVRKVLAAGCEKVVLNTIVGESMEFIGEIAHLAGSQAVMVSIDVRRDADGVARAYTRRGTKSTGLDAVTFARRAADAGAGEILLYNIDRDGMWNGYDDALVRSVVDAVHVPVVACGGANSRGDLVRVVKEGHAQAAAAGSIFVYQNRGKGVLVNYPELPLRRATLK